MIINACSLIALQFFPDNHFDSIITDPPYELGFMGKSWDATGIAYNVQLWREALRVLKPGGHLLAFSGSRTYHRMTCAIEDAGFEIRDQIMWLYGSGFPKSLDVSKAIDKRGGSFADFSQFRDTVKLGDQFDHVFSDEAERDIIGERKTGIGTGKGTTAIMGDGNRDITAPATEAARQWNGWGTALKPAHEPICVARKPLIGTVAANVLQYGTGALNIDACRVGNDIIKTAAKGQNESLAGRAGRDASGSHKWNGCAESEHVGRWPANVIHDGNVEFPNAKGQQGDLKSHATARISKGIYGDMSPAVDHVARIDSDTSAARFFYCAKASKADRDEGLENFTSGAGALRNAAGRPMNPICKTTGKRLQDCSCNPCEWLPEIKSNKNIHPTVKPTALMQYLCTLVTPPGGHILDPFAGSGSTGKAAKRSGFQFTGIERDPEYAAIAEARINT